MGMGMSNCCKDCIDREIGCHGICEIYLSERKKFESKKRMIAEIRRKEHLVSGFRTEQVDKAMKRKGVKKGER